MTDLHDTDDDMGAATVSRSMSRLKQLEEAQRWIPVSEKLPESEITVITLNTYHPLAPVGPAQYSDGIWLDLEVVDRDSAYEELPCVTHWMPLPAPPEPTA